MVEFIFMIVFLKIYILDWYLYWYYCKYFRVLMLDYFRIKYYEICQVFNYQKGIICNFVIYISRNDKQ